MRRSVFFGAILCAVLLSALSGPAGAVDSPYDGWWYNKDQTGSGVSIEIQGTTLSLALYVFDGGGQSVWYTSVGAMSSGTSFSGPLYKFKGYKLSDPPKAVTPTVVGNVQVTFTSATTANMSWTIDGNSGSKIITKFMDDNFPGSDDLREINGWWWDESRNGMGFFVEAQGSMFFMAWYHYRDDESPRWYTMGDPSTSFPSGTKSYTGSMYDWHNGPMIDGTGTGTIGNAPVGSAKGTITFNSYGKATLNWDGKTFNLTRFRFGALGGSVPMQYAGKTGQAAITPENAVSMAVAGLKGVSTFSYLSELLKTSTEVKASLEQGPKSLQEAHARAVAGIHTLQEAYGQTYNGNCGGTVSYHLDYTESGGTFGGSFTASNYCNNGLTLDGSGTLSGSLSSSEETINASVSATVNPTTITTDIEDITLKGTLSGHANGTLSNLDAGANGDFLNRDNLMAEVFWANNFVLTITEAPGSVPDIGSGTPTGSVGFTLTGRYYHPAYGYCDIASNGPFTVSNSSSSGTSGISITGSVISTGANGTKSKFTPIGTSTFQVEVDTNGDGTYDWNSGTLNMSDFFPVSDSSGGGGGGGGGTQQAYWGADAFLCCPSGTYGFKVTLEGQSSTITYQDCDDMPTLPAYIATTAGAKTFSWQDVSTACSTSSGTVSATLAAGKCYRVYRHMENNQLTVTVFEDLEGCPY